MTKPYLFVGLRVFILAKPASCYPAKLLFHPTKSFSKFKKTFSPNLLPTPSLAWQLSKIWKVWLVSLNSLSVGPFYIFFFFLLFSCFFSFFSLLLFFCLLVPPAADWCGLALPRLRAGGHTLRGEAKQISFHLPTKYIFICTEIPLCFNKTNLQIYPKTAEFVLLFNTRCISNLTIFLLNNTTIQN